MELSPALNAVLQAVATDWLGIVLSALATIVLVVVVSLARRVFATIKSHLTANQLAQLQRITDLFVIAAEQKGLTDALLSEGNLRKKWVIEQVQAYLTANGLSGINVETISSVIEASVGNQLNSGQIFPSPYALVDAIGEIQPASTSQ